MHNAYGPWNIFASLYQVTASPQRSASTNQKGMLLSLKARINLAPLFKVSNIGDKIAALQCSNDAFTLKLPGKHTSVETMPTRYRNLKVNIYI